MRLPLGPIRGNPLTRQFLLDLMRETVAVGRAQAREPAGGLRRAAALLLSTRLPADMTSSMHHDLARGRPLEVRWLSGGVAGMGAALGVPTPVNRACSRRAGAS